MVKGYTLDEHYIPMLVNDAYQVVAALTALMQDSKTADQVAAEFNDLHEINGQLGRLVIRAGKHLHGTATVAAE